MLNMLNNEFAQQRTGLYDVLIQELPGERPNSNRRRQPRAWPLSAPTVSCLEAVHWELAEAFVEAFNYAERKHPTGRWASVHIHTDDVDAKASAALSS